MQRLRRRWRREPAPPTTPPERLRVLFYAVNGLGLGHVSRLLAIARALRRLRPEAECLFLTASEADWVISREGFASFKAPSHTTRARAGLDAARHARTVQSATWALVAAFDPHVMVVDTFPAGALQELLPLMRWPVNKVFVFREQQAALAADAFLQEVLGLYQLIIVPHNRGEMALPLPLAVPAVWTGPILSRERTEALPRGEAERRLGLPPPDGRLRLYINFGGGGDPQVGPLLRAALAAAAQFPGLLAVLAPGPLAGAATEPSGALVVRHYPMAECLAAFDLALSAAGYNAVHELLHHGVPTAFVPVAKGIDDQEARVARAVAAGAALRADAATLADALRGLTDAPTRAALARAARALVPPGGAEAAARAILSL